MILAGVKTRLCIVPLGWHGFRHRTLVGWPAGSTIVATRQFIAESIQAPTDLATFAFPSSHDPHMAGDKKRIDQSATGSGVDPTLGGQSDDKVNDVKR